MLGRRSGIATAAFAAARRWSTVVSLPALAAAVGIALAVGALAGVCPHPGSSAPAREALRLAWRPVLSSMSWRGSGCDPLCQPPSTARRASPCRRAIGQAGAARR